MSAINRKVFRYTFGLAAAFFLAQTPQCFAQGHVKAELLSEAAAVAPGQTFLVAVHLTMDPGWHTYWKNPGDSGMATRIKWTLPSGFSAGAIQWPEPQQISAPPLMSYGYEGETYLLVNITAPNSHLPAMIDLKAHVDWLECADICVPGKSDISMKILSSPESVPDSATSALFSKVKSELPLSSNDWKASAETDGKLIRLKIESASMKIRSGNIYFYVDHPGFINHAAAQSASFSGNKVQLDVPVQADTDEKPEKLAGVLFLSSGWRGAGSEKSLEIDTPLTRVSHLSPQANGGKQVGLLLAILFSFLGGILLNLMPCVLPVLSIKVLGFVKQGNGDRGESLKHGLIFTAGVLVSFWTLVGLLLSLRAGGHQLGWGFQLQSPIFVAVLAFLFFILGLSLFGLFEIGTSLLAAGDITAGKSGYTTSFLSGVLATVVATPCTAPFMGSALGFALSRSAPEAILVFTALAIGMALPYLLLAANPRLLKFVPKPGPWMETFKQAMGFLFMATVLWLLWVASHQQGSDAVLKTLAGLLITAVGAWIYGRWGGPLKSRRVRWSALLSFLILVGLGFQFSIQSADDVSDVGLSWEPYSVQRLQELQSAGKPVFVDFTASWCLTCQVNERVVFRSKAVRQSLKDSGLVLMKADWTSHDDAITKALESYGRSGVPTYVLYGRDPAKPPKILSEVLTPNTFLDELSKISAQN